jgi:hypothetical protein
MYAVVGRWTLDPAQREDQKPVLMERIVPGVRQLSGLVERYWAGDEDEGDRAFTFIVFDTLDAAESFAADIRGKLRRSERRRSPEPRTHRRPGHGRDLSVRSTRGALPVFQPVGFPESPPEPGVPVVPAPGSPQVPLRTAVMVHPVAGHGLGMAVPR